LIAFDFFRLSRMVVVELGGLCFSTAKVFCRSVANAVRQAVALNAPNGNLAQKIGAVFGYESTTQMLPKEARLVLGFEPDDTPTAVEVRVRLEAMERLNDLQRGGSPYLQQRFLAAAHILARQVK
jgi:hypothetical protein